MESKNKNIYILKVSFFVEVIPYFRHPGKKKKKKKGRENKAEVAGSRGGREPVLSVDTRTAITAKDGRTDSASLPPAPPLGHPLFVCIWFSYGSVTHS